MEFNHSKRNAWIYIMASVLLFAAVQGTFDFTSLSLLRETACDGYPMTIRCPGTDVIEVVNADYGRKNRETCSTSQKEMENVDCQLEDALSITSSNCNNKTSCTLLVTTETFSDPCPGTSKYLQVEYRCLKYMFGCPGSLIGIGSNATFPTTMRTEIGSWRKDPIHNPDHVFFVSESQHAVQEYTNMRDFIDGDGPAIIYNLPSNVQGTSFLVYDRYIYYVMLHSRNIVKFSLGLEIRVKKGNVPGKYSFDHPPHLNKVDLSVDEKNLWAIYVGDASTGRIDLSQINKNTLLIEKTWHTSFLLQDSLFNFLICGVLYVVGSMSGEIEYLYNTNTLSGEEKITSIGFDQSRPTGMLSSKQSIRNPSAFRSRSFLSYNFSSLVYNPRDRLLYGWELSNSAAVTYNLHFGQSDPVKGNKPVITSTTTVSTTIIQPSTTTHTSKSEHKHPTSRANPVKDKQKTCDITSHSGFIWPKSKPGEVYLSCPDGNGKAHWSCITFSSSPEPQWGPNGPDISECNIWASAIKFNLENGIIDDESASVQLHQQLLLKSSNGYLDSTVVEEASGLISIIADDLSSVPLTQQLAQNITSSVNILVASIKVWEDMAGENRYQTAETILKSMEKLGLAVARSLASRNKNNNSSQDEKIIEDDISVYAALQPSSTASYISSPLNNKNRITLPANVQEMNGGGLSAFFIFYKTLGMLVNAPFEDDSIGKWKVDADVVSVGYKLSDQQIHLNSPMNFSLETHTEGNFQRKCVYWSYSSSNQLGVWRSDGCRMTSFNRNRVQCSCNHLSSFTVLVSVPGISAASVIIKVGMIISLLCLLLSFVTFCFFKQLKCDRNTIHKHLCISLFIAEATFLFGINQTYHETVCAVIAGILHFTFLASFVWVALESFQLYILFKEVFEERSRWKWYCFVGYGVPLAIVAVSAAVGSEGYGNKNFCWLKVESGFIWTFVAPVCVFILCNFIFLGITFVKVHRQPNSCENADRIKNIKKATREALIFLCLLIITCLFGVLWAWDENPVLGNLFSLFIAIQGIFIFIFHCLLSDKAREGYKRMFKRCMNCRDQTQNSYVTNSLSFSKKYPPSHPTSDGAVKTHVLYDNQPANGNTPEISKLISHDHMTNCRFNQSEYKHPSGPKYSKHLEDPTGNDLLLGITTNASCRPYLANIQGPDRTATLRDDYDHIELHHHVNSCKNIHHLSSRPLIDDRVPPSFFQKSCKTMGPLHPNVSDPGMMVGGNAVTRGVKSNTTSTMSCALDQNRKSARFALNMPSSMLRRDGSHLSGIVDESAYLRPSTYLIDNSASVNERVPPQAPMHSSHSVEKARRSMTSSGSDDPIVNDLSTSSSGGSKPSSIAGTFANNFPTASNRLRHSIQRLNVLDSSLERDENDLEVQRLTEINRAGYDHQRDVEDKDEYLQRDSAFYQSAQELDDSPPIRYSSNSSNTSRETPDAKILHHRHFTKNISKQGSKPSLPFYPLKEIVDSIPRYHCSSRDSSHIHDSNDNCESHPSTARMSYDRSVEYPSGVDKMTSCL